MIALGLDIGTSKICVTVIDSNSGKCLESFNTANDTFISINNKTTRMQDASAIKNKAYNLVNLALDKYKEVECIGVTGQMHGIVYLKNDFSIASPLFTWQDDSGDMIYKDSDISYAAMLTQQTGYRMASGFGLTTLYYHKNNNIDYNADYIATIHGYIACCLADFDKITLHSSDAHSLGLYDLKNNKFDEEALKKAGISKNILPHVVNFPVILGRYKGKIPVCVAIGDNQAGFIGSGCDDDILVNIGTGSQLSFKTALNHADISNMEIRPLSGNSHIFVGASLCGGRAFAILKDFYEDVIKMAGLPIPSDMYGFMLLNTLGTTSSSAVIFSTLFCGTRKDPSLKACISNLTADNFTASNLTYATLKGIIDELYFMFSEAKKIDTKKRQRLIGSGNGIRKNPILKKILEETFAMPLFVPINTEEAAYGAALYALTATGHFKTIEQAQNIIRFEGNNE
ncbi:MAG: FGGY family carbohydrate kinase [Clostridia bacterium]|jgi:sedoheptulokinase